ncbi:MAG TPA: chemotaxis protein CheB [Candidatus Eremiobacteraceae bacterium]|nr:chemotaxis protein CheB [Candidatus Eremiobacteraceae bacterium]
MKKVKQVKPKEPSKPFARKDLHQNSSDDLSVVAIGASAGGIEAFKDFVRNLPTDTGFAFVFIQHLDPTHQSILSELVAKETKMPVSEVRNGLQVAPNHIFIIPPNSNMTIAGNTLELTPREDGHHGAHMSVDHFMRSLAEAKGNRAIGVILSGSGSDGTLGMAEIQAQGGVTFAQDEATARYDGMPHSAVAAGCADYILPPKGIARELSRIAKHPFVARPDAQSVTQLTTAGEGGLETIFQLLRRHTGVDFTHYRQTTILRRIQRRMLVHKIDKLNDYVRLLQTSSAEIKALYQDMLINVTSFFRNPKAFEELKTEVFPEIFKQHSAEQSVRVWTPGCASGEEAYSLAIVLLEYLGEKAGQVPIQIFGTDVSETSIARARTGIYPENIQGDVSPERLRRFFTKVEGGYRISKSIRDVCIFAQHNLLSDPPFSQMDLISCRNLLIYLEPVLQNKVISLFHYAARPEGYLLLGTSEGVGSVTNLFSLESRAFKIFRKKAGASRQVVTFSLNRHSERAGSGTAHLPVRQTDPNWNYLEAQKEFDRRVLTQFSPATAFINEDMEIIHTRGNVSRYLKLASGRASLNILKMAREGILLDLRNALGKAKKENTPVQRQHVQFKQENGEAGRNSEMRQVDFEVVPVSIGNLKEKYFMVVFRDSLQPAPARRGPGAVVSKRESEAHSSRIAKLEQELTATKEYLQAVVETQEATNEELQSANEEILSSNEELQSTNEELETAKEELQSANEELSTVNDELRSRNLEVSQVNTDLTNLLDSIEVAVVMIGSDLTIRRFTPRAQKFLGLIATDVGRPLLNINPVIEIPDFQSLVLQVMANFRPVEKTLTDPRGGQFQLRILPYRTLENKIDGAVITIVELSNPTN